MILRESISILTLLGFCSFLPMPVLAADTYPYPNVPHCGCEADGWAFFKRQCTSYVAWKANESGTPFTNGMTGPNSVTGWFGNAENWDNNAASIGYIVDNTPSVGTIAVLEANQGGAGPVGHVAWVESVNPNGTANISEYNWFNSNGSYYTRSNVIANHYIHLQSASNNCGANSVMITNMNVLAGNDFQCSATETITVQPETFFYQGSNIELTIN